MHSFSLTKDVPHLRSHSFEMVTRLLEGCFQLCGEVYSRISISELSFKIRWQNLYFDVPYIDP